MKRLIYIFILIFLIGEVDSVFSAPRRGMCRIQRLTRQIKQLEKSKQSMVTELRGLKDLLKQKELEIEKFKEINNNLVSIINKKINKINILEEDINNLRDELERLNKKIKEQDYKITQLLKRLKHTDEERDKMWNISFFLGFALLSSVFAINTIK